MINFNLNYDILIALLVYFLNIICILLSTYKNFKLFKYEIHFKLHIPLI